MTDKAFVDTNVLIYAHDADAGAKHDVAVNVLRELWSKRSRRIEPASPSRILRQCHAGDFDAGVKG